MKFLIAILLVSIGVSPALSVDLPICEATIAAAGGSQPYPQSVAVDGDEFACGKDSNDLWSCRLRAVYECPLNEDDYKRGEVPPQFIAVAEYLTAVTDDLSQCLSDWKQTPFDELATIIDDYAQKTTGVRFTRGTSQNMIEIAVIRRLDWKGDTVCGTIYGLVSAGRKRAAGNGASP